MKKDLSFELEHLLRDPSLDNSMDVNDFFDSMNVPAEERSDFVFAAVLNGMQKFTSLTDEEFEKLYQEYVSNLKENENA